MKKQDAVLSLNPEAIDTVEKIIAARQRQGMPFDRDTVLSGIVNTYAPHALEALQTSERFRPIYPAEIPEGRPTNLGGTNHS